MHVFKLQAIFYKKRLKRFKSFYKWIIKTKIDVERRTRRMSDVGCGNLNLVYRNY